MKTIFIVNPNAGSGKRFNSILKKIEKLTETSENVGYYITKKALDAKERREQYIQRMIENAKTPMF